MATANHKDKIIPMIQERLKTLKENRFIPKYIILNGQAKEKIKSEINETFALKGDVAPTEIFGLIIIMKYGTDSNYAEFYIGV